MWDLPGPGLEPTSPALAGRFLTTAPPGKHSILLLTFKLFPIFGYYEHSCACFKWTYALISLGYIPRSISSRNIITKAWNRQVYLALIDIFSMVDLISLLPVTYESSSFSTSSPKLVLSVFKF